MSIPSAEPARHGSPPRPLRRLTLELFGIVALKVAVLTLIWWVVFAPYPKPDAGPAAMAQRLAPSSHAPVEGRP
ncbi:MAG: hypothetical protein KGJ97_06170 [Xanthomonadaceae bacterium]|nr:hypothetical protein [Xanthomonadaceae bacterium]MDE3071770.1 hypothetical protein [Pseudomonadota bacterium]